MLRWLIETIIGCIIFGLAVYLLNWMFKAIVKIIGSFIRQVSMTYQCTVSLTNEYIKCSAYKNYRCCKLIEREPSFRLLLLIGNKILLPKLPISPTYRNF